MICLVGPGGAGKSTVGAALSEALTVPFHDLDLEFTNRYGDITTFLNAHTYALYCTHNVQTACEIVAGSSALSVLALSSGFMTYSTSVHPQYPSLRLELLTSESTYVLLPSLDLETCVAETVRRQLGRPFARAPGREEQVIRARFPVYAGLPVKKICTMRPVAGTVAELLARTRRSAALTPQRPSMGDAVRPN